MFNKKVLCSLVTLCILVLISSTALATPNGPISPKLAERITDSSNQAIIKVEPNQSISKPTDFASIINSLKPRSITRVDAERGYKEGEVIVRFKPSKSVRSLGALSLEKGLKEIKSLDQNLNLKVVQFDAKTASMQEMLNVLNQSADVEYAEPNYIFKPFAVSDPLYNQLWGLKNTGQTIEGVPGKAGIDINVETAWLKTKGSTSNVIAVIDTGADIDHPDLKQNIWINPGEIANDGIDNDSNGYVDDVNGWNFFDGNNDVFYSAEEDAHGTHVAGTIAGRANTEGVIGVAPNVKVMPLKFIGPNGGYLSDAILAINYAKGKGVKISNNSWGGGGYTQSLYDVIKNSNSLFIAAAGNAGTNNDTSPSYPSSYDLSNILSVAAIENTGNMAYFSNYGATSVDVAAPGVSILSTTPLNTYDYFNGTSMATPHATGAAALISSFYSSYTPLQIKDKIINSVTKLTSLTGKVGTGGYVNAGSALSSGDADGEIPGVSFTGTSKSSTLNVSTDKHDVYKFSLLKGEKISVSLTGATGTDFDLYFYDSSAKTVNSSIGIVAYSDKYSTSTESFTFTAPSDGVYYLDIFAYAGSGSYTAKVVYGVTAGVYENTSSSLVYNGIWTKVSNASASGGSYSYINSLDGSVQLVFTGTGVSFSALKDSLQGKAKVTLDGASYSVDLYSATPQYKATVFSKTGLTYGRHTLKIQWTGLVHTGAKKSSTRINLDSITVK